MKFIYICILAILISVFFHSCKKKNIVINKNDQKHKSKKTHSLIENGEKTFILDDESQPRNRCVQLFINKANDSIYFTFYNEYNNSIYFYDFNTTTYLNKIQLQKEGNNGVFPHRSGYFISSLDTIYFYSMSTERLYVLNRNGEKYHTIHLRSEIENNIIPPTIKVSAESPIYEINQKLYLCGSINEELENTDSIKNLIVTQISPFDDKSKPELSVGYPESYRKGNWGDAYFRNVFWCYNKTIDSFFISFANDHYIYRTDLKKMEKIYAGSSYADNIQSIDHPSNFPLPKDKRIAHYLSSYYYRAIIYDKYRNVYYRIVEHPWVNFNPDERPWKKPISIIILDSNFNFIGETLLSNEYCLSGDNFLVAKEGFLIRKETENEDELKFTIFNLIKYE